MPAFVDPSLQSWIPPKPTESELDWAPLIVIDLAKWDSPGGKQQLARDLTHAVRNVGFWVVINSGIPQEAIDRQFSLATTFFNLPLEEKNEVKFVVGEGYVGYYEPRLVRNTTHMENMEILNLHKFTPGTNIPRHAFVSQHEEEITAFQKLVFDAVITKIFILFAIILELPEDHFVNMHVFEKESDDHVRYIKYKPRTVDEDKVLNDQWMAGHTDFGSITLLFPQPIAGLQVLTDDGWKWVKYVEGGITCNAADLMSLMTKVSINLSSMRCENERGTPRGYVKSAIHRVVRPPPDQAHIGRLGVFFFVRPTNTVIIKPSASPVLKREGLWTEEDENFPAEDGATCSEFIAARIQKFNVSRTAQTNDNEVVRVKNWEVRNKY
ncbi:Flavonol synthase [Mycena venus]|uniref:Flavonol synthase n=1 Tax=Mycena venus TaxID=2733690 RepID=A0A8H6YHX8_9AGAR|nr:Flavonol synthase [Mycena venus]